MSSFTDKTDFVANVLSKEHFKDAEKPSQDPNTQDDSFFFELDQIMMQFPYIIASWRIKDTLKDDDEIDFNRYINQFSNNFDELCANAID